MRTSPSGSAVTLGFRFPLCLDGFFQRVEFDHPRAARLLFLPVRPFQPQALTPYRAAQDLMEILYTWIMAPVRRLLPVLVLFGLWLSPAEAVDVKLRPQSPQIEQLILDLLRRLSSSALPLTLDKTSGTIFVLAGAESVAFNPDVSARTLTGSSGKRVEFNPRGPINLKDAVETEFQKELGLGALTPEAAQMRFSGADLNGDGKIDTADLAILMGNFGRSGSNIPGDLNNDGRVDDLDVRLFSAQYKLP